MPVSWPLSPASLAIPLFLLASPVATQAGEECTIGVAAAHATADGRPLLWKNRDTRGDSRNHLQLFPGGSHAFLGLAVPRSRSIWGGVNAAGLAVINAQSADLGGGERKGYTNGAFIRRAPGRLCRPGRFHGSSGADQPDGAEDTYQFRRHRCQGRCGDLRDGTPAPIHDSTPTTRRPLPRVGWCGPTSPSPATAAAVVVTPATIGPVISGRGPDRRGVSRPARSCGFTPGIWPSLGGSLFSCPMRDPPAIYHLSAWRPSLRSTGGPPARSWSSPGPGRGKGPRPPPSGVSWGNLSFRWPCRSGSRRDGSPPPFPVQAVVPYSPPCKK